MFHFIVSWEIYIQGEQWGEINDRLKVCLDGYNIVKLLKTTYVVKLEEQQQYAELHKQWSDIAEEFQGNLEFVMSPLMKAGQYAGYFRREKWDKLTSELGNGQHSH